jgi:hypothetical protein
MNPPDFKPSDVQLVVPPLVDTFGRAELEHAASVIVRACQFHGDTWQPIKPTQVGEAMHHDCTNNREPFSSLYRNPFFTFDFAKLAFAGFTSHDEKTNAYSFTDKGFEQLRKHVAPPMIKSIADDPRTFAEATATIEHRRRQEATRRITPSEETRFELTHENLRNLRKLLAETSGGLSYSQNEAADFAEHVTPADRKLWWVSTKENLEELEDPEIIARVVAITGDGPRSEANAKLFAHARRIILSLLDRIDELETKQRAIAP